MCLIIEDKDLLKKKIKEVLSEIIPKPNKDILSINVSYDPNLSTLTLRCFTLNNDKESYLIFDDIV